MNSHNIAIISTTQGQGYGAERILESLVSEWMYPDLQLAFIAPPNSSVEALAAEVNAPFTPLTSEKDSASQNYWALRKITETAGKPALIHAWSARAFPLAKTLASRWNIPASGTLHDHPRSSYFSPTRQWFTRNAANKFSSLVTVSRAVERACRESNYQASLTIIKNGLPDIALPKRSSRKRPRIGFLGMYNTMKGFPIIQEWITKIDQEDAEWRLYGEIHPLYESQALSLSQAHPNVTLCHHQSVATIFSDIDILLLTSEDFDSLPTVLIEAARAGCPTIASASGGASEIITPGETGFIYNTDDTDKGLEQLLKLIKSTALQKQLGMNARKVYQDHFTAIKMIKNYHFLWNSLL